eukprot:TRINITY_DN12139_c0_g2_i10.p1 TRINITY_DN12139_c0_g2~~TRINITY_DN12139_c0_g2_i10.p1  ORF type:complete len:191 (+),score=52.88 TRINITY_DN12139_c0_g2_i10:270-842(+)
MKAKVSNAFLASTPACLFEITNNPIIKPSQANPPQCAAESPEERRSSLASEATPATICAVEDEFMVDSLNVPGPRTSVVQESRNKENKLNVIVEEAVEGNFMNALQTAIEHFEDSNVCVKQKPSSSFSNTVTSTSEHRDDSFGEVIKRQYNSLLIKYNELKTDNKKLMTSYAALRSEYEEVKAVFFASTT